MKVHEDWYGQILALWTEYLFFNTACLLMHKSYMMGGRKLLRDYS